MIYYLKERMINMKKKLLIIMLSLFFIIPFTSCKKNDFNYDDLNKITYENLLNLNGTYLVIGYQANCPNCEKLKDSVSEYVNYLKDHDGTRIYAININLSINKDVCLLSTDVYPSDMLGTKDYTKIKIKATPSLFVITDHSLVKVISDYNTQKPVTDIKAYLKTLM